MLKIILLVAFYVFSQATFASQRQVSVCVGEALGQKWDREFHMFIKELFVRVELKPIIMKVPAKRAEYYFMNKKCEGFVAASSRFDNSIGRSGIFHVKESILYLRLEIYSHSPHPEFGEDKSHSLMALLDKPGYKVGYFNLITLGSTMSRLNHSKLVPIDELERGFMLVEREFLDFFIFPEVESKFPDKFIGFKKSLKKVTTFYEGRLYIWLDNDFSSYSEKLSEVLATMKKEEHWQTLGL